jgi:hypothetical protein
MAISKVLKPLIINLPILVLFRSCSQPVQGGHTGCGGQGPSAKAKLVLLRNFGGALLPDA